MEGFLKLLTYVSGVLFLVFFARKLLKYWMMPMHVRWELYPIPHEGKDYGGSFYEDVDHWKKERHKDHFAQYRFMIPEILFIRALHEDNRPLWYWSMPFHMGLYLCIGGLACLAVGAVFEGFLGLKPDASALASLVQALAQILGVVGFVLGTIGAIGLIIKRMTDPMLTDFTVGTDYLNLIWLGAIFVTGFLVWLSDPRFVISQQFLMSLITFKAMPQEMAAKMTGIHVVNLLLFLSFWVYFPFTYMTHMVSKYFMWDKVKWDDDPNVGDPTIDAKIKEYLGYRPTWAASHVGAEGGTKTWAEVATTNPWAQQTEK